MKRSLDNTLLNWKARQPRKPLILRGARQTGKTYAVRKLGETFERYAELNFERTPELTTIFEQDLHPQRIIRELSPLLNQKIEPGKTLLLLDEIHNCPKAITALRYFYEEMPELHVISTGSLLEFALGSYSVPVGRVEYLNVHPFTIHEFFRASGNSQLADTIINNTELEPMPQPLHNKALDLTRQYLLVGGMPGVLDRYLKESSFVAAREEQESILQTYTDDFLKYSGRTDLLTIRSVFRALPAMVGRQTKYSKIAMDVTPYKVKQALEILDKAMVICRVRAASGTGLPLGAGASHKHFKTIFLDVGLMQCAAGMPLDAWLEARNIMDAHGGAVAEQFAGQELLALDPKTTNDLYYWQRNKPGSLAEVDYLFQHGEHILPIEVKSSATGHLKSMHQYIAAHPQCPFGIKACQANFLRRERLVTLPLYAAPLLNRIRI